MTSPDSQASDGPRTSHAGSRLAPVAAYGMAIGALALGWLVRLVLSAWSDGDLPMYITFYPAVMAAALLGGRGPGLLATVLAAVSAAAFLMPPDGLGVERKVDIVSLALFCSMGVLITALAEGYRTSRNKAAVRQQARAVRDAQARSERALKHSEASYRLLIEQAADGIFVADASGRYLEVNQAGTQLFGYSRDEILAKSIPDLIFEDEVERLASEVAKFENGAVVTSEWRFRRKDGSCFLGEVVGRQLPDGRLQAIVRDISERRRVESDIRRERALLATITAATDTMLVYLDRDFNFVWVNQAYADTCHMTPEQMVGKNHFALYPHAENEAIFRHVRDTGIPVAFKDRPFEFPDQPERGITYWDWSLSAVRDDAGDVNGLVFSLQETTASIRAQRALRRSEERYRRLFENMAEGFALLDTITDDDGRAADFRFVDVNSAFERLTGLKRFQVIDHHLREVLPGIDEDLITQCGTVALGGEPIQFEKYFQMLGRWYEIHTHQSSHRQLAVLFVDTTQRRAAEEALKAAKAEAERANEAKSRFLAAASHDLRQPLSGLSLYAHVLKSRLGSDDAALLANIENCIRSLSELLTDLLDLSKLQAGVVEARITDFPVDELLGQIASTRAPEAQAKGLRLRYRPSGLTAHSDPVLLGRVLGNLVDNALRYTHRGGVLIGCRRHSGKTWIEVWDTGIGIPADKTAEIFEEFSQLDNEERGERKGSGLGLAIVAKVAGLLGLEKRVSSRPGKGSLFAIELVVSDATDSAPPVEMIEHKPICIGLVEDNDLVLQALVCALEGAGHRVVAATSGRALRTALGNETPDLVISDYRLSRFENGFDVITQLRNASKQALPGIVITGDTDPDLMRSMSTRGVTVLHKPVKIEVLKRCISALMEGAPSEVSPPLLS